VAYATPSTVSAGDAVTATAQNILVNNDIALAPFFSVWTSFTPTITNVVVGNGTHASKYLQVGRLVIASFDFTFGSTSSISGAPVFSLPVAALAGGGFITSQCVFLDAGTNRYAGMCELDAATQVVCQAVSTSGAYAVQSQPNATTPFTWTTSDRINVGVLYQSAS